MMHYREAFEYSRSTGFQAHLDYHLDTTARQALQGSQEHLPASIDEKIAVIPSATALLQELFAAMREAQSTYLLVDVRHNPGGNSLFATMLEYFLYGMEAIIETGDGYQIKRYSPLYFQNNQNESPERFEQALQNQGYDFTEEQDWQRRQRTGLTDEERAQIFQDYQRLFSFMPTFASVFEQRIEEASWTPQVAVLTSAYTYSAGFDMVLALRSHGAQIVGVPSSQAANCFIDALRYTLKLSGLEGSISFKRSLALPNDPEHEKVLRPDKELTYAYLKALGFDPYATVKLALEHLGVS